MTLRANPLQRLSASLKGKSFLSLARTTLGTAVAVMACSDATGPGANPDVAYAGKYTAHIVVGTRIIYLGAAKSEPINFIRAIVYDQTTGDLLGSLIQTLDPAKDEFDLSFAIKLPNPGFTTTRMTIELANRNGTTSEIVQYSGRRPDMKLSPGDLRQVDIDLYPGPLDNFDVSSLKITNKPLPDRLEGDSVRALAAVIGGSDKVRIVWSSLDSTIARIDATSGMITGKLPGTVRVVAAAGFLADTAPINILRKRAAVVVTPATITLSKIGDTATYVAKVVDPRGAEIVGETVSWTVANPAIGVFLGSSRFRSTGSGQTTVTATSTSDATLKANAVLSVSFVTPSLSQSTIVASPASITANGTATSSITVRLKDGSGNNLPATGSVVTLSKVGGGTLSAVTDNRDGSYTATLTAPTVTGLATTSGAIDGGAMTSTAVVRYVPGPASLTQSIITANPNTIVASSSTTITVRLRDEFGNDLTSSAGTVALGTTLGALTGVVDNGDGTYTATLTSGTVAGVAVVSGTLNGTPLTKTVSVAFGSGLASTATSTVSAAPTTLTADGTAQSAISIRLKDINGNNVGAGGLAITATVTGTGTLSALTDNGSGSYSATLTAPTLVGSGIVTGFIGGTPITNTATVTYVAGPGVRYILTTTSTSTIAGSTVTITAQLVDVNGNPVKLAGRVINWSSTGGGSFSPAVSTTDANGSATVTFTTSTVSGTSHTITATDNSIPPVTGTIGPITTTASAVSLATSTITATPASITANGTSTSTIAIQLKDAFGNNTVAGSGQAVALIKTGTGTLSSVTSNGGGSYTAVLTSPTVVGSAVIGASLSGVGQFNNSATVNYVAGPAVRYVVTAGASSVVAGGTVSISAQLVDLFGNPVSTAGRIVTWSSTGTGGSFTSATSTTNASGLATITFTSSLTSGTTHTVTGTDNSVPALTGTSGNITTATGSVSLANSTISASPTSILANGTATSTVTVQLKDAGNNNVTASGGTVTLTNTGTGSLSAVTDNSNGSYTATLTAPSISGSAVISARLAGSALTHSSNPVTVTFTSSAPAQVTSLAATAGNTQVALTWIAPSNGGSAITDYLIEYKLSSSSTWLTFNDGVSTTTSGTVTGLTNGSSYDFRVSAINGTGTGTPSSTATATPVTGAGAPTALAGTPGNTQVALTWTAPSNNGGSVITDYLVEYKLSSGSTWTTFADGVSTTAAATVTGLTNGSSYDFRVSAINATGTGTASSTATATPRTVPNAPTSLGSTAGDQQMALTWTAPANNGGSAITDYLVEYKLSSSSTWLTFNDGVSTTASATVTGLTNGSSYDFRVSATNIAGTGVPGSTLTGAPITNANAPTSVAAAPGNQQAVLTWTAPVNNGGSAITDYLVEYKLTSSSTWLTFSDGVSATTGATVTGLTNGSGYDFRVSAINTNGTGAASSTATATPRTVPNAPTSLGATTGDTQMSLAWTAPVNNGGSAITDYLVEYKLSSSSTWLTFNDGVSTTASATVTGLTNGSAYDFRVSATNVAGTGAASPTATGTPGTSAGAPTGVSGTPGNTQVALTWTAPSSNGGSAITDYLVEYKLSSSSTWLTFNDGVSTTASATVTGLTNGSAYDFRVSAINGNGTGAASSTATATPRTVPGAPTSLATTVGNQQMALTWTAPANNGGSAITDYLVEYKLASSSTWLTFNDGVSTTASATVTGLTNGSSYDFRVSATNVAGTGVPGSTATATPVSVAGAPTSLAGAAGDQQVVLTWTAPASDGGSAITDYLVEYKLTSSGTWLTFSDGVSATTGATVTGLTNGSSYDFRVSTVNANGTGTPSSTATATPLSVPGAPTSLAATPANQQVALTWTAPASNGGSAITDYLVEYKLSSSGTWLTFNDGVSTTAAATVTGLTNGSAYDFRVSTINANGTGPASSTATATPRTVPDAPTSLVATPGNTQMSLAWTAPANNGGSAITDYLVEYKLASSGTWLTFNDGISTTASATVTGLTNGSSYDFRVSATNVAGTGAASSTATATPISVAGAPTSLAGTAGNQQVALTWTAPASNGGSAITDYIVEYKLSSSGTWLTFNDGVSASTGATVTGLTNGSAYDFRVSAVTSNGTGTPSSTATATPVTVPGAPTSLAASVGSTQIALTWTAPASNGGSAITDYLVEYKLSSSGTWLTFNDGVSASTGATVTGLTNGSAYDFRVSATNAVGTGAASSTATATPATLAGAPTSLAGTAGDQQVDLTWTAPASDGGSAITDYLIEYKLSSSGTWLTFNDGTNATPSGTVTGLTNGSAYDFRVSTVNANGTGSPSSTATATPRGVPGAPTALAATAGNQQVGLTWTAPASNGGSAITDYLVEYKLSSSGTWLTFNDGVSTTASTTVTGLTNGSAYDFRVSAINAGGTGSASSTATATPRTVPDAPTSLATTAGNQQMALTWTAPANNGGSAITDYLVEYKLASSSTWLTFNDGVSTTASTTVTGLTNGSSYDFRVSATNVAGTGVPSSTATATPISVAGAPTSLSGTAGNQQVALAWTAPVSNGGSAITDYLVEYKLTSSGTWLTFNDGVSATTGATVTGLTNGSSYDFRVSTINGNGTSSPSSTATATPVTVPGAPTSLTPTAGNTQVALTWTAPVSDGGSAITDYVVEYKLNSSGTWLVFNDGTSTATSATVTGLTNGSAYNFRVSATNAAGTGPVSSTANSTPVSVATSPTSLVATAGNAQVGLTWTTPGSDGGSAITDYLVEYKLSSSGTWLTFNDGVSTSTAATVTGLTNGSAYDFRVSAITANGTGNMSSTATATPVTVPGAPTSVTPTAGNTQVALTWTAPASNGGSAITDYVVEYKLNSSGTWLTFNDGVSTTAAATVTGLTNGSLYDFRVSATNSAGTGAVSSTASSTPRTVPGAPTNLAGVPASTSVALTWTAPASNGGSAITDYLVEYKQSSSGTWLTFNDGVSTTASATVTGLTNNVSYDFRVSATNVAGTGAASSTITAVAGAPTSPISLSVTLNQIDATNHTASLTWTTPTNTGGSAITDYLIEYQISGAGSYTTFVHAASTATTASITGLANGTTYNFRVAAKNSVGTGPYSNIATASTTRPSDRLACSTPGASNSSANSASITGCTGIATGNFIIIPISIQNASTTTAVTVSAPSGFTSLGTELNGDFQTTVFYKVATSSDLSSTSYGFSWSGNIKNVITLVAYKTVSGTPTYFAAHGTSTPMTSPTAADPSLAAYTLVYVFTPKASMGSTSPTLGQWTISNDLFKNTTAGANNAQAIAVLTADIDQAGAGSIAARTGTTSGLSSGNQWNVSLVVIHP